ncbi:mitogen-activated protein kinase kinase kinase kinase 4-like [Esox lucius]|uniref:mitogen-activated protein kinase kinase kinase kinase 4-like n=1 Tax=Esox lucius TaxID=8010 RepID=UPI0014774F84|nr:mitogen-activated protein kinase kinase kinase kinase 4-like [Esox lucius]
MGIQSACRLCMWSCLISLPHSPLLPECPPPLTARVCLSVFRKVQWSNLAPPPIVSRSPSFSEPMVPSFAQLHLRSQGPQHHPAPSSSSSSSPARTDPQPHPQPRALPLEKAPTDDTPPRGLPIKHHFLFFGEVPVRTTSRSPVLSRRDSPVPWQCQCHAQHPSRPKECSRVPSYVPPRIMFLFHFLS